MDDRDARREAREKERLFQRGVATTHDGDVLAAKEEAVTGGARRESVTQITLFSRHVQHERSCLRREDHGLSGGARLLVARKPRAKWSDGGVEFVHLFDAQVG